MELHDEFILPVDLTGYVRAALANYTQNNLGLAAWLPDIQVDDLEYRLQRGGNGLTTAAGFRVYDAEAPIGTRKGLSRISGELPPISRKVRLGEYDRLRQRKVSDQNLLDGILSDADNLVAEIAMGIEVARGGALANGITSVPLENGQGTLAVDWARRGGNTVTAATLWSNGAADPLSDMLAWQLAYRTVNGVNPGSQIISSQTLAFIQRNGNIRNLVFPGANQPSIVSITEVNSVLAAYGVAPFYVYDAQASVAGSATPILPVNKVILVPAPGAKTAPPQAATRANQLGATLWGTTAESLEPDYGIVDGAQAGIVAGVYKSTDPVALWTKGSAIALPTLANPDLSFVATVS